MQHTRSQLLLVFGLAAPLVPASSLQTAAMNFTTPTTLATIRSAFPNATQSLHNELMPTATIDLTTSTGLVTMASADPTATQSLGDDDDSIFDPIPTTSPTLSVVSDYKVPTPTPGSVAILNGIPTRVLSDAIDQTTPILADTANAESAEGMHLFQPWNTSYPGPIHDDDWVKYLQIWDPIWWSANLDSLRQTACQCSTDDFYTNPQAKVAAYMNFEYYSHQSGAVYSLDWLCGPATSSMTISQRITSAKGKAERCWQAAGGEFFGDHDEVHMQGYFCDEKEEFCVEAWREGRRSLKFHDHKRNYDRDGVHTWSEIQPVVTDVCTPICKDKFGMRYDDFSHHNPNFITTFYPPKPIDLAIIGD